MRVVEPPRARDLAKKWRPVFCQGFEGLYDLIVPINFGDFVANVKPQVYYSVKEDSEYFYILYAVYHYKDWATHVFKKLDSHRHDFEGTLRVINRDPYGKDASAFVITVFHYDFHFCHYPYADRLHINIESKGHGQRLELFTSQIDGNHMFYRDYRMICMDAPRFRAQWAFMTKEFNANGVKMPDQWNDARIQRKFGKKTDGLIYTDPKQLLDLAKKAQRI